MYLFFSESWWQLPFLLVLHWKGSFRANNEFWQRKLWFNRGKKSSSFSERRKSLMNWKIPTSWYICWSGPMSVLFTRALHRRTTSACEMPLAVRLPFPGHISVLRPLLWTPLPELEGLHSPENGKGKTENNHKYFQAAWKFEIGKDKS